MANYKGRDILNNAGKGEIAYKNHTREFLRFFEAHKRLCDEMSGLKYHVKEDKKIRIKKTNFRIGIKKLNSFIIDFLHYIEEKPKRDNINSKFEVLENDFINDIDYDNLIKKHKNLTPSQEVDFNKRYMSYLMRAFEISYLMSKNLQKSLNIASKEIVKDLNYVNYDGFFNNLSTYREEMANDLSNLGFDNLFDSFKKITGYFYTYKYLIMARERKHIDDLLRLIYLYIISEDTIKIIIKSKNKEDISDGFKKTMRNEFIVLRGAFNKVYYLCNYSLSNKNILPKVKVDVLVDNTLI